MISLRNEHGAIAIFISMAISLLLVTATTYATRLSISELRQSGEVERSDKSYFAAEAGIEEALHRIDSNPDAELNEIFPAYVIGANENGDRAVLEDIDGNQVPLSIVEDTENSDNTTQKVGQLAWRNRRVYKASLVQTGTVVKDEPLQFDFGNLSSQDSFNNTRSLTDVEYTHFDGMDFCWSPSQDDNSVAATLEWTVVHYPIGNPNNITTDKALVQRVAGGNTVGTSSDPFRIQRRVGTAGYDVCHRFEVQDKSRRYVVRLKPLFEGAGANPSSGSSTNRAIIQNRFSLSYQMFINQGGFTDKMFIDDGTVLIDVVGESGDVRRRVVAKKERNGRLLGIFDFLLYQGEPNTPLCKLGVQQSDVIYDPSTCQVTPADQPPGTSTPPTTTPPTAPQPLRIEAEDFDGRHEPRYDPASNRQVSFLSGWSGYGSTYQNLFINNVPINNSYTKMTISTFYTTGSVSTDIMVDGHRYYTLFDQHNGEVRRVINLAEPLSVGDFIQISLQARFNGNQSYTFPDYVEFHN